MTGARGSGRSGGNAARASIPQAFDGWEFWWESNHDRFLRLRDHLGQRSTQEGSPGQLTSRGARRAGQAERPDRKMIDGRIIPSLATITESADDRDILDSIVLAMGRSASDKTGPTAQQTAVELLSHNELSVQSSAALSLGVLGNKDSWPLLTSLMRDDSAGRAAVGGGSVPWLVRAFAALALGLLDDARAVRTLMDAVNQLPDSERDVKASAIAALGLVSRDSALAATVEVFLVEQLARDDLDPYIGSYIPTSLGKLGGRASVDPLLQCFTDSETENVMLQSAIIGLGQLASMHDTEVLEALERFVKKGADQQGRHFALIALAEIGSRDHDRATTGDAHEELLRLLIKEMGNRGSSRSHRSWAAIAGAIYARSVVESSPRVIEAVRKGFTEERDPSFRGAFAIALGLLDDQPSRTMLHKEFRRSNQDDFRGYASVALGLLRHKEASEELLELCQDKTISPTLRLKTATSLGLMGDRDAVPVLVSSLEHASSLEAFASSARALGLIGDRTAVGPLLGLAQDTDERAATRAFACVALGLLGENTPLPFNEALKAHNNYRAPLPSIIEVLRIL